jgi:hypothetical protein
MTNVELSVSIAANSKNSWNAVRGDYHTWSCDSDYYRDNKKELDKVLPEYGFKPLTVVKLNDGKRYYTPVMFIKDSDD